MPGRPARCALLRLRILFKNDIRGIELSKQIFNSCLRKNPRENLLTQHSEQEYPSTKNNVQSAPLDLRMHRSQHGSEEITRSRQMTATFATLSPNARTPLRHSHSYPSTAQNHPSTPSFSLTHPSSSTNVVTHRPHPLSIADTKHEVVPHEPLHNKITHFSIEVQFPHRAPPAEVETLRHLRLEFPRVPVLHRLEINFSG